MRKPTSTDPAEPVGLPDLLAPDLKMIFCGINPGLRAARYGHHFLNRSNRFWRVLHQAGFTPIELSPQQDKTILLDKLEPRGLDFSHEIVVARHGKRATI